MAGSSLVDRWDYVGDGRTRSFAYRARARAESELVVYVGGALRLWPSDYTVSGAGQPDGGAVVFAVAPPTGASVEIERRAPQDMATTPVAAAASAASALMAATRADAAIAVADHGAVGDGTTDDTDAIAAAEAARAPGQTLRFAAGTYLSRGNAVTKSGIWDFAPGATLRLAAGRPAGT